MTQLTGPSSLYDSTDRNSQACLVPGLVGFVAGHFCHVGGTSEAQQLLGELAGAVEPLALRVFATILLRQQIMSVRQSC